MKPIAAAALLALSTPALAAPAALAITVGPVTGSAQFQPGRSDVWFFARTGRTLPAGASLKTEVGSTCVLFLSDGTKLRLRPQSNLRLVELSAERTTVSLGSGRLEAWAKRRAGAEFRIVTPMFTATWPEGVLAAEILSETSATLDIFTGEPTVIDSLGKSQKVSPGQRMELGAVTGASTPAPLPAGGVKPEEPAPAGPAMPAAKPRQAKKAKPAPPAETAAPRIPPAPPQPEAAPKKAKAAEPPPPDKSAADSRL